MIFRLSVLLISVFIFPRLQAQETQYIVKLNGDTISGKLQINPLRDNSHEMVFKVNNGSRETIRPLRVQYVYYNEEYQYRSVAYFNRKLFMQILKEDENISYYNYIHKRDNSIATTKVVTKPDGEALELSALTFKKQVKEFLEDCPQIIAKLDNKEYRYKDYATLFADYNDCDKHQSVATSTLNNLTNTENDSKAVVAAEAAVVTAPSPPEVENKGAVDPSQQEKLSKLDAFRQYVRGVDNFEYSKDLLEWLADIEYRVSQNDEIPNYLWNSLNAMTADQIELKQKAEKLKKDLQSN